MDTEDRLVVFQPSGRRGRFALGTPLLDAARSLGVYIESVCGGRAMCARCQIEVTEGRFDTYGVVSSNDHLSPMGESERRWKVGGARRMSCQARIMGDLVVDVPSEFAVNRQVVRKRAEVRRIALDTATKLVCVSLPAAEMEHPIGDADRLIEDIDRLFVMALFQMKASQFAKSLGMILIELNCCLQEWKNSRLLT